jgi:hypothetical protein
MYYMKWENKKSSELTKHEGPSLEDCNIVFRFFHTLLSPKLKA